MNFPDLAISKHQVSCAVLVVTGIFVYHIGDRLCLCQAGRFVFRYVHMFFGVVRVYPFAACFAGFVARNKVDAERSSAVDPF